MNRILLFALMIVSSISLSAQIKKGSFMLEGGINLPGNWNYDSNPYTEGFGISFGVRLLGVFARKYFGNRCITPFIDGGIGIGWSQNTRTESSAGGAIFQITEHRNLFYLSGTGGASWSMTRNLKINVMVKIQHTEERFNEKPNYSTSQTKTLDFDSALVLSFSYFLNRKAKSEQE